MLSQWISTATPSQGTLLRAREAQKCYAVLAELRCVILLAKHLRRPIRTAGSENGTREN